MYPHNTHVMLGIITRSDSALTEDDDESLVRALSDGLSELKIKEVTTITTATETSSSANATTTITKTTSPSELLTKELDSLSITSTGSSSSFAFLHISDELNKKLWQRVYDAWSPDDGIVDMDLYDGMGKGFGDGAG